MTRPLACLRCGHEGTDVATALVDLEAEARAEGGRVRQVEVVREIAHRHVTERVRSVVPERFGTEWRCRDRAACDARWRELQDEPMPPAPAAPADEEEVVPWL